MRPLLGTFLAVAGALPLAACLNFGAKPPPTLMSLSAETPLAAGGPRTADGHNAVAVYEPSAPQALATPRVAVQVTPTAIAYLAKAQWAEPPAKLFRNLLAETIAAKTGRVVADPRVPALAPDTRLTGRLVNFGLDAGSHNVVVTYDATLSRGELPSISTQRFEARVPVSSESGPNVAQGLNRAANQVASDVAAWIGS